MGSMVPIFSIYKLSGTFLQNNSGIIPFISENQEKSWKHMFLTFFQIYEINKKQAPGWWNTLDSRAGIRLNVVSVKSCFETVFLKLCDSIADRPLFTLDTSFPPQAW